MDASRILNGLNEAQKHAVTSEASVLQILAPPGSGKTKTLTSRVSWLLFHHSYKPWNIICLTFTIKSAREMKERIAKQIGEGLETKLILGTFHSVCLRYLRSYGHLIGLSRGFDIADSSDSQAIVKRIIKQNRFTIDPSTARSRISHNKAKNISYLDCQRTQKKSVEQQEFLVIYEAYQTYLSTAKLLDYDDLLVRCAELLRSHPQCVANVEAVLIDEFQDTNHIQFDLMQLFATHRKRISTVGDPDQSIYGWRSAEIGNLSKMQRIYPDTLVLNLENNYRSSPMILKAAQMVIEQDESRPQKTMVATHCGGSYPVLRRLHSPKTQAAWITTEIKRCRAVTGNTLLDYSDFAILIRSAALSRQIESSLANAGIPYRMVGGQRFFDRKEIKVLLDYVRVATHPENNDAIARIINYPPRGIGEKTIKAIQEKATSTNRLWWSLITDEMGHKKPIGLKENVTKGLRSFFDIINTCNKAIMDETNPKYPLALLELVIKKLDFETHLEKEYPEDHEQRWANVEELKVQASEYDAVEAEDIESDSLPELDGVEQEKVNPAQEAFTKFLGNIALSTEVQSEQDLDDEGKPLPKVTISTIHAAKGLEWPVVFIPCVYKGSIPHSRSEDDDEERRLLYVAMTRAQALLYMTTPSQGSQSEEYTLSPFLDERNVLRYLNDRAPSIYDQLSTISGILRRPCPSVQKCQQAITALDCIEDDEITWPLDGSKGIGNDGSNNYKIAELDDAGISNSRAGRGHHTVGSVPAQSGFVSATSQLKRALPADDIQGNPPTSKAVVNPAKRGRSNKTNPGQATIGNFFAQNTLAKDAPEPDLPVYKPALQHSYSVPGKYSHVASVTTSARIPLISRFHYDAQSTSREPLKQISVELSNHQISKNIGLQRHKISADEYHAGNAYMLLSSSPTKPSPSGNSSAGQAPRNLSTHTTNVTAQQTTMAVLQQQSGPSRRTLGLGRTFKQWTSKPASAFSIPKISKPRPS